MTFRYKDYRRNGSERHQVMTLEADEFIRRYLLPRGDEGETAASIKMRLRLGLSA